MLQPWRLVVLLLLLAASALGSGFLFPDEDLPGEEEPVSTNPVTNPGTSGTNPGTNPGTSGTTGTSGTNPGTNPVTNPGTSGTSGTNSGTSGSDTGPEPGAAGTGAEDYGDYGPTVDPLEGATIEERFFFNKDVSASIGRKLGAAASSLLNTLNPPRDSSPLAPKDPYGAPKDYYGAPKDPYGAPSPYGGVPAYGGVPGYGGASPYGAAVPGYGGAPSYGGTPTYGGAPGYGGYSPSPGYTGDPRYLDYDGTVDHVAPQGYKPGVSYPTWGQPGYQDPLAPPTGTQRYSQLQRPAEPEPDDEYADGDSDGGDYGDYGPKAPAAAAAPAVPRSAHGFPVDQSGRIQCGRVPRRQKKACRKAKRQQRRQERLEGAGGGGVVTPMTPPPTQPTPPPTPAPTQPPVTCPTVPDKEALQRAADTCCVLQSRADLYGFNNCCQTLGFCPICPVDSEKLAKDECCPIQHEGDTLGYRQCCSRFGTCPECGPAPTPEPEGPVGCLYKGKLFPIGETLDRIASKCMFVYCKDNGAGPEIVLDYIPSVGCCEREGEGTLYPPGHVIPKDDCTNLVCENEEWVLKATDAAAIFARPCPEGWLDIGGSCVFIWRELMTFNNATIACGKLKANLALPQNRAQLTQLINEFRNMEGRDSTKELGGWMNVQFSERQWRTLQGDTLTFAPWEEGHPDDLRRTNCVGLTVTQQSQGWKDYMCDNRANMMYPVCQVPKPECGELSSGCGPYQGDVMFTPNSEISIFSNSCERFVCNKDSYAVRHVNPECCYHHEWNAQAFGRDQGWYSGLFAPGGFEMFEGMLCECKAGKADCTQFF